jgi:hypothetical protein
MAVSTKFVGINTNGDFNEYEGIQTSSGAAAGDIVALNSSAQIDASLLPAISATYTQRTDTASFSALYNHLEQVDLNTAAANVTATLPDATTYSGQGLLIQVITASATHHVAFATVSSQTINGAAASSLAQLVNVDQTYFFISDGSNWWTISPVTNLTNNVTGTLAPASGGTGATSVPTNGEVLIGNTGTGVYDAATIGSSDSTITWTTGAGSLTAQVDQGNLTLSSIGGSLNLATQVSGILPVLNGPGAYTATAGSTNITAGAMIYLDSSNHIQLADANTALPATGFAPSAITASTSGTVVMGNGPNAGLTGLTAGDNYFLGHNGAVTTTPPTTSGYCLQKVGSAPTTSLLNVLLGPVIIRG